MVGCMGVEQLHGRRKQVWVLEFGDIGFKPGNVLLENLQLRTTLVVGVLAVSLPTRP